MLCETNVGFAGNLNHPARQTLRTVPLVLNGEPWWLQFSPYQYYEEHAIAFSDEHRPMSVTPDSFARLLDFVDLFPHYFMGSNAALPIVGGSILTHDHYQGGLKVLPMMNVGNRREYSSADFPDVAFAVADWYNSVVRLSSRNKKRCTPRRVSSSELERLDRRIRRRDLQDDGTAQRHNPHRSQRRR